MSEDEEYRATQEWYRMLVERRMLQKVSGLIQGELGHLEERMWAHANWMGQKGWTVGRRDEQEDK